MKKVKLILTVVFFIFAFIGLGIALMDKISQSNSIRDIPQQTYSPQSVTRGNKALFFLDSLTCYLDGVGIDSLFIEPRVPHSNGLFAGLSDRGYMFRWSNGYGLKFDGLTLVADTSVLVSKNDTVPFGNIMTKSSAGSSIGAINSEIVDIWNHFSDYYTKAQSDGRYLQSYTETDPTVASYIKAITSGNISTWNTVTSKLTSADTVWIHNQLVLKLNSSTAAATYATIAGLNLKLNISDTAGKWKPANYVPSWISITGKPSFSTVATSGSYNDLSNLPTIPTNTNQLTNGAGFLSSINSAMVTGALGFTPYNASNPSNFISRSGISLTTTGSGAASYNSTTGVINVPTPAMAKRQITLSGTTNASGIYSGTFSPAFAVPPNIQAGIVGGTPNQVVTYTVTTTGFTCTAVSRNASFLSLLGLDVLTTGTTPVNGASIDVLITEK